MRSVTVQLVGNENESEIGNGATRRCDWCGVTHCSWVRDSIMGSWVRCSWVRCLWVCGFAVRGSWVRRSWFAVRGSWVRATRCSWVRQSQVDDLAGGATISTFLGSRSLSLSVCACESFLSLFLSLRILGNDLKVKFWLKIFSRSKALILRTTEILFQKIHFPYATKHPHLWKNFFESDLKPKQTQP